VVSLLIGLNAWSAEPSWHGSPLSVWLSHLNDLDKGRSGAAETALKSIGTNAVPYLIKLLSATPPAFGESLAQRQSQAVLAFRILGDSGAYSLPVLGSLLTNQSSTKITDPGPIAQAMAGIGERATPWLAMALSSTRSVVRRASMVGLIDLGAKAQDEISSVQQRLRDDDPEVRSLALLFVSAVCTNQTLKTSILKAAAQDTDPHVRRLAETELKRLAKK